VNTLKKYEGVFIFFPNLEEEVRNAEIDKLKNVIASFNGTLDNVDLWGQRRLAYEIKKSKEGYYALMNFTAEPEVVKELDRVCGINERMLRHMIIRDEK
jgi:small subunit ribosomal protein S6